MIEPYYSDDRCELYLGKAEEVLPALGRTFDACVTDPPYQETSLRWDRWPDGWPALVANATSSMWVFGSMRMFLDRRDEFAGWKLSQDVIWEKPVGTSMATDRFKRVHEFALHWYRGRWDKTFHETPREVYYGPDRGTRYGGANDRGEHLGAIGPRRYEDDGTRLAKSVIRAGNLQGRALHPTQKPVSILEQLISYSCPAGGGGTRCVRRVGIHACRCEVDRSTSGRYRGRREVRGDRRQAPVPGRLRLRGCRVTRERAAAQAAPDTT